MTKQEELIRAALGQLLLADELTPASGPGRCDLASAELHTAMVHAEAAAGALKEMREKTV